MTGPEHYREAEQLLDELSQEIEVPRDALPVVMAHMQAGMTRALVHATLAAAAATALGRWTPDGTLPQPDRMDWWRVASGEPAERKRIKEAEAAS